METFKNYCASCLKPTNHTSLFNKKKFADEEEAEYCNWEMNYMVVECLGCNNVSFRREYSDEYSRDLETGEVDFDVSVYPLFLKDRRPLSDTHLLPENVFTIYDESIGALKSDCKLLAAAGFRAVIEAVCKDKDIAGRDILRKIDNLHSKGFLSKTEADRLHAVRFLGNDSIHEIDVPSDEMLNSALLIIEHLLSNLYIIDKIVYDNIETMIQDYQNFEWLINRIIRKIEKEKEFNLTEILGKSVRRITPENLVLFEKRLQEKIKNGSYTKLILGTITEKKKDKKTIEIQTYIAVAKKVIQLQVIKLPAN